MTIHVLFSNYGSSTLIAGITASSTSVTLTSVTSFPTPSAPFYFYGTLVDQASVQAGLNPPNVREVVRVTAVSGNTFTITRGLDGTSPAIFNTGDYMQLKINALALQDIIAG